ncbi:hypothetical protein ACHAW6_000471 [Cyclotella cf. meneghiniana]
MASQLLKPLITPAPLACCCILLVIHAPTLRSLYMNALGCFETNGLISQSFLPFKKQVDCFPSADFVALSMMETEYVALGTSCKELFPILDKESVLCTALNIPYDDISHIHIIVHEDNVSALTLAGLEPRCMTPCSKHYAIMYHWFWEHVEKCRI